MKGYINKQKYSDQVVSLRLRDEMDRLGMSIKDLAKTLDVSYASAFAMAHGNSELHAAQAKRLEDEWGCDSAWLLCLT